MSLYYIIHNCFYICDHTQRIKRAFFIREERISIYPVFLLSGQGAGEDGGDEGLSRPAEGIADGHRWQQEECLEEPQLPRMSVEISFSPKDIGIFKHEYYNVSIFVFSILICIYTYCILYLSMPTHIYWCIYIVDDVFHIVKLVYIVSASRSPLHCGNTS